MYMQKFKNHLNTVGYLTTIFLIICIFIKRTSFMLIFSKDRPEKIVNTLQPLIIMNNPVSAVVVTLN